MKNRSVFKILIISTLFVILTTGVLAFLYKDLFVSESAYLKAYNAHSESITTYYSTPPKQLCAEQSLSSCLKKVSHDNGSIKNHSEYLQRLASLLEICIFFDADHCDILAYNSLLNDFNLESLLVNEFDLSAFSKKEEFSNFLEEFEKIKNELTKISEKTKATDEAQALVELKLQDVKLIYSKYRFKFP